MRIKHAKIGPKSANQIVAPKRSFVGSRESNGLGVVPAAIVRDMGIDHRRTHITMPQPFLNRPNVGASRKHRGRKAMAPGRNADLFGHASLTYGDLQGTWQPLRKEKMPAPDVGLRIGGQGGEGSSIAMPMTGQRAGTRLPAHRVDRRPEAASGDPTPNAPEKRQLAHVALRLKMPAAWPHGPCRPFPPGR